MFNIRKPSSSILMLFVYSFILIFLSLYKINSNPAQIPTWDDSHHLMMGYDYFESFENQDWGKIKNIFIDSNQIYPPLYHMLIAAAFYLFGVSITSALYLNLLFIPLLIFSTYSLGKSIFHKKVGILSALLIPILPMFLNLQESVFIDYLSISLLVTSFAVIFKTDFFRNTKYSLLFGFIVFLELMSKWPFLVPSVPIVVYFINALIKSKSNKIFINTFYIFIFIFSGLIWYHFNIHHIIRGLSLFWDPNGIPQIMWGNAERWSFENIFLYIYPYATSGEGMGIIPLLFFFGSSFIKGKKNYNSIYITSSIIITFLTLTYLNDKAPKYLGYVYPFVIIYTLGKCSQIKNRAIRQITISVFILSIVLNFILSQFSPKNSENLQSLTLFPEYHKVVRSRTWPTDKIAINEISKKCQDSLLVLSDSKYLNPINLRYYFKINHKTIYVDAGYNLYDPSKTDFVHVGISKDYNCIISKSGDIGMFANRTVVNNFESYINSTKKYKRVNFEAPDESLITLYYE